MPVIVIVFEADKLEPDVGFGDIHVIPGIRMIVSDFMVQLPKLSYIFAYTVFVPIPLVSAQLDFVLL